MVNDGWIVMSGKESKRHHNRKGISALCLVSKRVISSAQNNPVLYPVGKVIGKASGTQKPTYYEFN
jgi:hypothetical protein